MANNVHFNTFVKIYINIVARVGWGMSPPSLAAYCAITLGVMWEKIIGPLCRTRAAVYETFCTREN